MTAIYEFSAYLRVPAASEAEAINLAADIAATVSRGETTLGIDESPPVVEDDEESA